MLDPAGRVTAGNASAGLLWPSGSLIGAHFASLFAFEIVSREPEFLDAQWEAIQAGAMDGSVILTTDPGDETPGREVRIRLEKNLPPATGFIATLRPPATRPTTSPQGQAAPAGDGLSQLIQHGAAGYFDIDFKTGTVTLSPAWKKILGYTPPELPDTLDIWRRLIHPDDSAATPDRAGRKATPGPRALSVEFRMRHQRGHWVWIHCLGLQIIGATGEVERALGLHLDISERKELEDSLMAGDGRMRDLSEPGLLPAFELDFTAGRFWFSPAWEALLGHSEGTLPQEEASFAAALPPEEASIGVREWLLARAPGQTSSIEAVRLRSRDGRPVPVLLGLRRDISRKREILRVVGFACPLPADASLDAGSLPTPLALEAFATLAEGVILADARGKVVFLNATAARLLRLAPEAARGQPVGDILRFVNRQSRRPVESPVDRALTADRPLPLIAEDALLPASAETDAPVPIVWTARASFTPDARPQGVVIVFRDPEEMTLTPEELVKANRFEALGLLAGGIAHDFNNLLTTILGTVSIARDNRDHGSLGDAEKACLAAKALTKQLLAFAKGGGGTQTVSPPLEILSDSIIIAAAASTATIGLEVPEGTDTVLVDRAQILQVFQNLIVNALQAMPPPPHQPRLQIRAANVPLGDNQVSGLAAGDYVAFEVRDNGSGIKPEHVAKIFDPFFTTKKHGTGLGLATVASIVRRHGGQIALDTEVGVGTAFTVYLPKAGRPAEIAARRAPSLRFGTGRVLFMDDDPKISSLTATMLESLNYKYDLAKTGEEAIALYKRYLNIGRPYDAVIMDLTVIGGMGGEECFVELKKLDPEVRAIVASGYDNDEMARQFLEQGFCGYLGKPYRVADLGKVLKTVLG